MLALIAIWSFVTAEEFVALGTRQLLNLDLAAIRFGHEQIGTESTGNHGGPPGGGSELKSDMVEGALGECQFASRTPEQVVPQLGIIGHLSQHLVGSRQLCLLTVISYARTDV